MKKDYIAPALELLAFCPDIAISSDWQEELGAEDPAINSQPWNNGELGWI